MSRSWWSQRHADRQRWRGGPGGIAPFVRIAGRRRVAGWTSMSPACILAVCAALCLLPALDAGHSACARNARRPVEGPLLAASRTANSSGSTTRTASGRISFAKIREPLEVPNLLALQTESFDWLLGNAVWQSRVASALENGRQVVPTTSGLEEIFEEISPIEDFSGSMSLSFRDHR